MKKILKVFMYVILSIFLLVIIVSVVAKLAENKITDIAMEQLSESIETPMEIDAINFNLLRGFPLATIELKGMWLGAPALVNADSTLMPSDTLVNIQKIYVSVKSRPLLDGIIEVVKVEIAGAEINYTVNAMGASNYDFLIDTTQTEELDTTVSEPLDVILKELFIRDITINYSDSTLLAKAKLQIPNLNVNARIKDDFYKASVVGGLKLSDCSFEGTNLNLMNQTVLNFDVDYIGDSLSIKNVNLVTDGAIFQTSGSVLLHDEIATDIKFKGSDIVLGELMKYAPAEMLKEYGLLQVAGTINLNGTVNGIVSETDLPKVNMDITFENGKVLTTEYPALKNISFSGNVSNGILANNKTTSANFKTFHVETGKSKFDVAFSVLDIDHPIYDVTTQMEINVGDFKQFMPDSLLKSISGVVVANLSTKGQLPDSIGDDFVDYVMQNSRANVSFHNFDINMDDTLIVNSFNARMAYVPNSFKLTRFSALIPHYNLNVKQTSIDCDINGQLSKMETLGINVKTFDLKTNYMDVSASMKFENPDYPEFDVKGDVSLNLNELQAMIPDTLLKSLQGTMALKLSTYGKLNLDSIDAQINDIMFKQSAFNLAMKNISFAMPDSLMKLENFSGIIDFKPELISIDKLSGSFAGLEFGIDSTTILNVYETIIQERRDMDLIVHTNLMMGNFDYGLMDILMPPSDSIAADEELAEVNDTLSTEHEALLPDFEELGIPHFLVYGKASANQIIYEKNQLDNVSMKFRFADSLYVVEDFILTTCGGEVNTSVLFDARKWDKPKVDMKNVVHNLDLNQLLINNDNFGDSTLTSENLSGILTSELHTRAFYIDGDWPTNKIRAKGNFTLEDGKIYDFQPLVDASVGIGGLKELDKMDFSTLTTSIFMLNNKVYVPKTDVVSNALDLSAFAMHGMTEDIGYEYHLVLHLGDVVKGKSDKLMEQQAKQNKKDGGTVERNGLNLVSMDIDGKKKNGFDNENLKKKFANNLNKQEGFLKLLFNPMLVNFSTDFDRTARNREIIDQYDKKSN
jgi:uncharacterized protein YutD